MFKTGWFNELVNKEGSLLGYGFFRIIIGFMLWRHAWVFLHNYSFSVFYQDKFYLPYFDWYPLPSEGFYLFVLGAMIVSGFFLIIGFRVWPATVVAFSSVAFHFFLNQIWYRHNRYFLILLLLLMILGPGARVFSLAQKKLSKSTGRIWSFYLIRLQMTLIYFASAFAKTLDPDWSSGHVLQERVNSILRSRKNMGGENLPFEPAEWFTRVLRMEGLGDILTFMALIQEYFLGLCLWIPKTRKLAIWVGVIFHGSIEFSSHVLVFSYITLATYFLVVRTTTKDRKFYFDPNDKLQCWIAKVVYQLDWLDKISFHETTGGPIVVQDRDGQYYHKWMALSVAGSCTVIPYLVAYPITWLKHFGIGKVEQPTHEKELTVPISYLSIPSQYRLWFLVLTFFIYNAFVYLVVTGSAGLTIRDLSPIDLPIMILIFLGVVSYYRATSREVQL